MSRNQISDIGAAKILEAIRANPTITFIGLLGNQISLGIETSINEAIEDNQSMVKGLADFIKSEYAVSPFSPFTWHFCPNSLHWHFNTEKYKLFQVCYKELLGRHLVQLGFPQECIQEFFADVTTVITSNIESLYNSRISVAQDAKVDIHQIINSYLAQIACSHLYKEAN